MEITNYAPVIIPTLNRYDHLKKCLESLEQCTDADKTEVFVALDYPPSQKYQEGWEKINKYMTKKQSENGFLCLHFIKRSTNCGIGHPNSNYRLVVRDLREKFDSYIFTEDDNVFSKNFLIYMNKGLLKYKDNNKVHSISGYNYPVNMDNYEPNHYAFHGYSAWGVGRWVNKDPEFTKEYIRKIIQNPLNLAKIFIKAPDIVVTLFSMIRKDALYGDTCNIVYSVINNCYSIFPKTTKVRNMGHDGSGAHGKLSGEDYYASQVLDANPDFEYDEIVIQDIKYKPLQKFLNTSFSWFVKKIIERFK